MKSAEELRRAREIGSSSERPARRGCYRRLLVVVREASTLPPFAVDYASAWAAPDAVARVAAVPHTMLEVDGATQGARGVRSPDIATAEAVRSALLARGIEVSGQCTPRMAAGANVTQSLAETAHRWGADVVLCDDRSFAHLAQAAACNVLFLPTDGLHRFHVPPRRIFVASDDSASALCAVDEARRVAGGNAELRRAYLSLETAGAHSPDSATIVLTAARHGDSLAHAIVRAAREWGADLLVVGTHRSAPRTVWRYGSVAATVALVADMPLLLVPASS